MNVLQKKDRVGEFIITRLIAESGCANVYEACREEDPQRRVALKVAHSDGVFRGKGKYKNDNPVHNRELFHELIRNEAACLHRLHHPAIVRVFPIRPKGSPEESVYAARAVNQPEQPWYLVLELLPYKTLAQYMDKVCRDMPVEWRLELFYQLLVTVNYIHQNQLAHCDLKPENIFLRREPQRHEIPALVFIDFGTSSHSDYLSVEPAATLPYAAPEALALTYARDSNISFSPRDVVPSLMDVWSLGVIFFELMTGEKIVEEKMGQKEMITTLMERPLRPISSIRPELRNVQKLDRYQQMMLQKRPHDRPPVADLIQALEEFISPPPRIIDEKPSGLFSR